MPSACSTRLRCRAPNITNGSFRATTSANLLLDTWRWDRYVVPKRRYQTTLRCVTTQKTEDFSLSTPSDHLQSYTSRRLNFASSSLTIYATLANESVTENGANLIVETTMWLVYECHKVKKGCWTIPSWSHQHHVLCTRLSDTNTHSICTHTLDCMVSNSSQDFTGISPVARQMSETQGNVSHNSSSVTKTARRNTYFTIQFKKTRCSTEKQTMIFQLRISNQARSPESDLRNSHVISWHRVGWPRL